jgi:hypothetical protein
VTSLSRLDWNWAHLSGDWLCIGRPRTGTKLVERVREAVRLSHLSEARFEPVDPRLD